MAFFSKKRHHKDQQAGPASSANGAIGNGGGGGPSQTSPGGAGAMNGAGISMASQQQQQQPAMYVASSSIGPRGESMAAPGMNGPSNPYNAMSFDGVNQQQQPPHLYNGQPHQQQPNGYPQYMQQQPGPPSQQSTYPGPGPQSNGMVAGASGASYGGQQQGGVNGSPQQSTYPNGIGINVPSTSANNGMMGPGGLPGRNFSASSANNASNGSLNNNVGPPLQPLPAPGPQGQAPPSNHNASQHGQSSGSHSSNPVSYPWSQRPIRLQPIQLARPSGSDSQAPLSKDVSPSPFPRYGHSVNPIAQSSTGDLYLFGGLVKDEVSNDLFMISCSNPNPTSAQSNESKALAGAPVNVSLIETRGERPCSRVGHASVSVGNVLIVWGGDTKTKEEDPQDNSLYLLNLGSREWTLVKVTGPSPQGRYGHAAAMRGSKFYIFGGQQDVPPGAPDDAAFLNDLWCFDLQNLKAGKPHWQQIQYAPDSPTPPKRTGHTMVNYADKLYVFGGTDGQYHYNDTWCFSPATNTWSELSCIGYIPVPREGHAATLVDDVVYVFGGRSVDGKDLEDLAAFKISNQRWYMFTNMGPAPSGRSGHAMATWHNKVFVLGGESYTTTKHEWPNMINMLDTGKIKYPSDSRSQQANRKTSNSRMHQPPSQQQQQQGHSNALSSSVNNKPVQNVASDELRRAVSPTGSDRDPNLKRSVDRNGQNGIANGSPAGSNSSPAQEPRRPIVDPRRAMSPINEQQQQQQTQDAPTRSLSPTNNRPVQQSNSFSSLPNGNAAYSTPPARHEATMGGPASTTSPTNPSLNALRANARSPSPQLTRSIDSHTQPGQPETFQTALSHSTSQGASSAAPGQREKWLQAALADAVKQGYSLPESSQNLSLDQSDSNSQLVRALLAMKREIADLRATMGEEVKSAEQQLAQANKGKSAALQEAAFYRAKIAALESNSTNDLLKMERSRVSELERKLYETANAKTNLERHLEEVEAELNHHRDTAQAAVEREQAANNRAEAAESSYSRSLTEYADLQRRAHGHEASTHEHSSKVAALQSQVEQLTAQNAQYLERLQEAEEAVEKHVSTLDEAHISLTTATNHSSEMESLWQKCREELIDQQDKVAHLEAELQRTSTQLDASQAQVADLEKALHATQEEAVSLRSLSTGHLQQLLSISRETSSRNIGRRTDSPEALQALQKELETHRSLADEAHSRSSNAQAELREAKAAHATLEKQVLLLRSELAALRTRHASAVEASSRAQALVSQRDMDLREKARALETVEVKNGLLRSLLAENGLSADENGSPRVDGESSANLSRKVAELEARLEQRTQAERELQSLHDDARHETESAQQRLRRSEEQIDQLSSEIQSLRLTESSKGSSDEAASRAAKAESDLAALQERHSQLETTHLKAVQYVKGTEKMFRRMKDELTRYKEQNETLEQELAAAKGASERSHSRNMSTELRPELDELRAQLTTLRKQSESSSTHNEELQEHIARLKSEYDQQLTTQQHETTNKIQECEQEIEELREALNRVQKEVEDTLAHNKQLEQELQKRNAKLED